MRPRSCGDLRSGSVPRSRRARALRAASPRPSRRRPSARARGRDAAARWRASRSSPRPLRRGARHVRVPVLLGRGPVLGGVARVPSRRARRPRRRARGTTRAPTRARRRRRDPRAMSARPDHGLPVWREPMTPHARRLRCRVERAAGIARAIERDRQVPKRQHVRRAAAPEARQLPAETQHLAEGRQRVVHIAEAHLRLAHIHHGHGARAPVDEARDRAMPGGQLLVRAVHLGVGVDQRARAPPSWPGPPGAASTAPTRMSHGLLVEIDAAALMLGELVVDDAEVEAKAHVGAVRGVRLFEHRARGFEAELGVELRALVFVLVVRLLHGGSRRSTRTRGAPRAPARPDPAPCPRCSAACRRGRRSDADDRAGG